MSQASPLPRHRAHIASLTPGRIRFKLHPHSRNEQTMKGIQRNLETREGVHDVRINPANGSVTMKYDRGHHSAAGIMKLLEDVDVLVESIGHLPSVDEHEPNGDSRQESIGFLAAVEDLNRRIQSATGIPLNLKLILPLSFVGAGLWSIGRRGLMIESVPGWLFLWFAFDMFVKLHPIVPGKPKIDLDKTRS
ncbi:MAG: hypothetical protein PHE55_06095 [Methylococcaceae bacterium]|nr:hypothetical protein [Methylococcaceae bacterium]